jgi:hypothetical protein
MFRIQELHNIQMFFLFILYIAKIKVLKAKKNLIEHF